MTALEQNRRGGQAHANAVLQGGGGGQSRAHADQLHKHRIIGEDALIELL
jgi:hypothetical protein